MTPSDAQRAIHAIGPLGLSPARVEARMRALHGTLDHLSHRCFLNEVREAASEKRQHPGALREWAQSRGLAHDFDHWERVHADAPE